MGGETQRHLHELLREDQEPFLLEDYIANRGLCLSNSLLQARTQVQLRGRKSVSSATAAVRFCKSSCFFTSSPYSPDLRRGSTLLDFPARNPCKSSSAAPIFLRQAAAASKVQRHPSPPMPGFGLFGSVLKKLTRQNRSRKHDIEAEDKLRPTAASSDYWPESNEEKSPSSGSEFERDVFGDLDSSSGNSLCESPFRFVLQRSPSSENRCTPEFSLPSASSPISNKEKVNHEAGGEVGGGEEEEEDKEQNSPVSVLDPPFNDDDDDDDDTHGDEYDLDGSYIAVQRTKQKLLQQLQRLDRLAGLDPIELEQSMEGEGADDPVGVESALSDGEKDGNEKLSKSSFLQMWNIPMELRRLVLDIIVEETGKFEDRSCNNEAVKEKVWDRLECWKEVESNTIDMMAEMDLRKELNGWNGGSQQHLGDVAMEIESAIFGLLVEELSGEPNT